MITRIGRYLDELASFSGVRCCSLVEGGSGLVVHSAGALANMADLSEAAVEFWRVHDRVKANFTELGRLNLAMLAFQQGWLAITHCPGDASLLLVAVSRTQSVDWPGWLKHARIATPFTAPSLVSG